MSTKKQKIVIIGAGLTGMISALILAKHGHSVTIIEQAPYAGAILRGFKRRNVWFDTGLHYTGGLAEGGALLAYLRYLGAADIPTIPFNSDAFDTIRFTHPRASAAEHAEDVAQTLHLPAGFSAMQEALIGAFPTEGNAIREYMAEAQAAYDSSSFLSFSGDIHEAMPDTRWQESLSTFLRKITNNEKLRTVLSIHCLLHGVSPDDVSFLQHARITASYFAGAHTFEGGGLALVKRLEALLAEAGVTVRCRKKVTHLQFSAANTIQSVLLDDGSPVDCTTVLYTGHPVYFPDLLPDGMIRPVFARRLRQLQDTVSAYILFGVAEQAIPEIDRKNLFICPPGRLSDMFLPQHAVEQGPFYVTACSSTQNEATKKLSVMAFMPGNFTDFTAWAASKPGKRPQEYKVFKEARLAQFTENLLAVCPELHAVEFIDGATPLTLRDYLHTPAGGIYGCRHSLSQFNPLPLTRIPNLYLAGQAIVAPGVLGVLVSAFLACGFIVGHDTLRAEVNKCR